MNSCQVFPQVADMERSVITFIALNSDPSNTMPRRIVNFKICPGCGDVLTRLTFVPQSKVNIVHVNFQVVSCSCFIIALITLIHNPLVDLLDVSLHVAGQICAVLAFLTSERLGNQWHYEASTFTPRSEDD